MSIEVEVDGQSLTAEPNTGAVVTVMCSLNFGEICPGRHFEPYALCLSASAALS